MPLGKGPAWDTPAQLDGLPARNWKSREGVTMRGTFGQCMKRWLELHPTQRDNCFFGWGPNAEGQTGMWERPNMVGYLERNGPPPGMVPHVKTEHVRNWLAYDKAPPLHADSDDTPPGHSVGGDGGISARVALEERRRAKAEARRVKQDWKIDPAQPWRVLFPDLDWTPPKRDL